MRLRRLFSLVSTAAIVLGYFQTALAQCSTQIVYPPRMGFGDNDLAAISGTSATDLWAVGWFKHDGIDQTLIEHFDGNNWTIVPSPNNPKYPVDALYSVSADSSSDAWAVGRMRGNCNCDDSVRPLALHWNGSAWSEVPMPPVREESSESFVIGVSIDPTDP